MDPTVTVSLKINPQPSKIEMHALKTRMLSFPWITVLYLEAHFQHLFYHKKDSIKNVHSIFTHCCANLLEYKLIYAKKPDFTPTR